MKRYCYRCETKLRLSELRCPYCRKPTMSWLHVGVITAFAAAAFFYLLRVI
jgi:RNA polymerase subunit RPABC4/transcription elongation factor Spt4